MNSNYRQHFDTRKTAQSEPIPGQDMVQNNAGGYAFKVDRWTQLERFLILGSEGGTYYVSERPLTVENANNVVECIQEDGDRVVQMVEIISQSGRAPKNDPALFVLAMCASMGNEGTRRFAFGVLPKVARIGTHLLHFANFMEGFRGWGRAARRGVSNWFLSKEPEQLGYQYIKYAQRDGWAMRDLLRLSHPQAKTPEQNALFRLIAQGTVCPEESLNCLPGGAESEDIGDNGLPAQVEAWLRLNKTEVDVGGVVKAITDYNLPREAVPTQFLQKVEVWDALLQNMPMTAMIRNLGKMTQVGLIKPMSDASKKVVGQLGNEEALQKARVHPINVLAALMIYRQGGGFRGKLTWDPVPHVLDALDSAFYASFKFIEPTGKNFLIGLDVSGSMGGSTVNGMPFMTAREASAAMCMVTARTEANWHVMGFSHQFVPLPVSPKQRLDDIVNGVAGLPFGATDCALPMIYALANKIPVDAFVIYTDNETWWGDIHPVQALQVYREKMGIPAKLVVCAMSSTEFSIADVGGHSKGMYRGWGCNRAVADPSDGGMLDMAGLDSAAPKVIADFVRG
jgi:60 kDa SS-A/Ro ribonucleoprotein